MNKTKQRIVNLREFLINKHNYIFQNVIEDVINQTLKEVEEIIDKIEREDWDCIKCRAANENVDFCKVCGYKKEDSIDNVKLQELKKELGLIENE